MNVGLICGIIALVISSCALGLSFGDSVSFKERKEKKNENKKNS